MDTQVFIQFVELPFQQSLTYKWMYPEPLSSLCPGS